MANQNAPNGFVPVRHRAGIGIHQNVYSIASEYATALGVGDPVQLTGTSRNIELAEAGNVDNVGVFAGCSYTNSDGEKVYSRRWPASTVATNVEAYVWDDPGIIFEVQMATCAVTDLGALADYTAGTPSATTGMSTAYLASTTATTGKTFRIERIADRPNNAVGAYCRVEVSFAEHVLMNVVSGAGGI